MQITLEHLYDRSLDPNYQARHENHVLEIENVNESSLNHV
jgi:hypothetical protein